MSDIIIRKLSSHEINGIDRLAKIKKFPSRESYLRYLIDKDLNEEIYLTSHLKYTQLVEQLLEYLNASTEVIRENHALISMMTPKFAHEIIGREIRED
ncbi:hypothetical protein [Turicibacter bilis]|uniref:hypothetical protein n=1 Tax=Turicibacter bilis TaxID=2735723 RepID=UPI001BAFF337|nr:hypothetical protein [Turicibacter bilis]MBS3198970.1 hypothetical protein [Turicibacter bilis]